MPVQTTRTWDIPISTTARHTQNPIGKVVYGMKVIPNPDKSVISLSLGDPTVFGNFRVHHSVEESLIRCIKEGKSNGYVPAQGTLEARKAVADKFSTPEAKLAPEDIIIACGCSGALDLVFSALLDSHQTLLIPRPGFSLYCTFAESKGFNVKDYELIPAKNWEIDLVQLDQLIDHTTGAVLINNPSNPCGSVFSKEHLLDIIAICKKHKVPVIADEIYCDMVFKGNTFYPLASLDDELPVIAVGGIAKKYLVPGWRVGWAMIYSRNGALDKVRKAMIDMSQLICGSNTLIQGVLPDLLFNTPESFFSDTVDALENNVAISRDILSKIPGLHVIQPQGAMYMMVGVEVNRFNDIKNDVEFTEKLMGEE